MGNTDNGIDNGSVLYVQQNQGDDMNKRMIKPRKKFETCYNNYRITVFTAWGGDGYFAEIDGNDCTSTNDCATVNKAVAAAKRKINTAIKGGGAFYR